MDLSACNGMPILHGNGKSKLRRGAQRSEARPRSDADDEDSAIGDGIKL